MGGDKQKLTKAEERDALLARLEVALGNATRDAAVAMSRTKAEIERSKELMDGFARRTAGRLSDRQQSRGPKPAGSTSDYRKG
jgi:hypothetical protein